MEITASLISSKGRHIKSLREGGKMVAQLWEYKRVQYVTTVSGFVCTRDEDNAQGINAALFPYKFNSTSLFRACRKKLKPSSPRKG